jgi:hypothetical protein
MKHITALALCTVLLSALCMETAMAGSVKSAGVSGKWSAGATWIGGVVPGPTDTVTIADSDTVTYDMGVALNAAIAGLKVGEGVSGILQMAKTDSTKLIINGNLLIQKGAVLKAQTNTLTGVQGNQMLIVLTGDLTYQGALFDTRTGSAGSTLGVINFEFTGSTNTTITMAPDTSVIPTNFEFNGIKINKSGSANVTLKSNIYCAAGSSSAPAYSGLLTFVRGRVITGDYTLITTTTTGANISGFSDSSYVVGAMGRGMSSSVTTRDFCIGDAKAYRPIRVRGTSISTIGHYVTARLIPGNANTGSSAFGPGIDRVSSGRYYQVTYNKGTTVTASLSFVFFHPSYREDDGVVGGSTNVRAALSTDDRANWLTLGPTTSTYTTKMDSLPRMLLADTLTANPVSLNSGQSVHVALARLSGTTDNSLDPPATAVRTNESAVPASFSLTQNYPNPFNPTTNLTCTIGKGGFVSVKVYDLLGREVATLVNEIKQAGSYSVTWNAAGVGSGMYFCRMQSGSFAETKKIVLAK